MGAFYLSAFVVLYYIGVINMSKYWKDSFYDCYLHGNVEKAWKLLEDNTPNIILKFCSGKFNADGSNDFLKSLKNDEIWLSSPLHFNDPFDCALNIGDMSIEKQIIAFLDEQYKIPDFYENMCNTIDNNQELTEMYNDSYKRIKEDFENLKNELFVSCFSSHRNLCKSLMWSHYANCHKGFCIAYDGLALMKSHDDNVLMPVFYKAKIEPLWYYFLDEKKQKEFQLVTVYTKSNEWKYEDEWRLLEQEHSKKGMAGYNKKFIPAKCVYVGCNASDELKKNLSEICREKEIKLYQMKMKTNSFELSYETVST